MVAPRGGARMEPSKLKESRHDDRADALPDHPRRGRAREREPRRPVGRVRPRARLARTRIRAPLAAGRGAPRVPAAARNPPDLRRPGVPARDPGGTAGPGRARVARVVGPRHALTRPGADPLTRRPFS